MKTAKYRITRVACIMTERLIRDGSSRRRSALDRIGRERVGRAGFFIQRLVRRADASGAPRGIVSAWNAAIVKALRSPDMAERIAREGAEVIASTPEEFGALIKTDIAKWAKVVKDNGLKLE